MKALITDVKHTIPVKGDGGYDNQSSLTLFFDDGEVKVSDPWDLAHYEGKPLRGWELGIPSGDLHVPQGSWEFNFDDEDIIMSAPKATWKGKRAGLLGRMSGFGSFSFGAIAEVQDGVFLLPEDNGSVPYKDYLKRHYRMLGMFPDLDTSDSYNPSEDSCAGRAADVAAIKDGYYVGESPSEYLELWWSDIRIAMAMSRDEFRDNCIRHLVDSLVFSEHLEYGGFQLSESCTEKIVREFPHFEGRTLYARKWCVLYRDEVIDESDLYCWFVASEEFIESVPLDSHLNEVLEVDREKRQESRRGRRHGRRGR